MKSYQFLISVSVMLVSAISFAADNQPVVGRDAAAKYFEKPSSRAVANETSSAHYLAIHLGKFVSSQSWEWGQRGKEDNSGNYTVGMTYRISDWQNTMDFAVRVDFNGYKVVGEEPLKMSVLPMILFPDSASLFPLYFGAGVGPGIFFKQVEDESSVSLDYQLLVGVRFFDVSGNTGFFVETGMKNHLLVTSSGQFNGVFLSAGALFTF